MQKIFSNNNGMLLFAFLAAVVGLLWAWQVRSGGPFSRSGAVVTAIGLVLLSRDKIVGQDLRPPIFMADSPFRSTDPEHYEAIGEAVPDWVRQDVKSRIAIGKYGPIVSVIGTLIWGFGDLPFEMIR
jgi:hypothetical protein